MSVLYSVALFLVLLIGSPYWIFRMVTSGKYREGLSERLGFIPKRLRRRDALPVIWLHAVSVGEVLAASSLIAQLSIRANGYRVVVSTTTRTTMRTAPGWTNRLKLPRTHRRLAHAFVPMSQRPWLSPEPLG